jgi:hypothetical protein
MVTFFYIIRQNLDPILISFKIGTFGILDLTKEPHAWTLSHDQGRLDEIKPIFASDETLDSRYVTATMALGISLEPNLKGQNNEPAWTKVAFKSKK